MFWRKKFLPRTPDNVELAKTIFVGGEGPLPARLLGLGMCPGFGEATASPPAPFQASSPAGGELNVYLQQVNLPRSDFYITNCFKYFVADHFGSDRPPTHTELESHWDILAGEIDACEPKVIACFGAVATKWMMEKAGLEYHGLDCHRGMPVGYYGKSMLYAMQHPAAGVHSPDAMKLSMADFTNLATMMRIINRGERPTLPVDIFEGATDYRRLHTLEDIADVWDDTAPFISIDTEGTRKHPIMLQFSFIEGTGYAIFAEDKVLVDYFRLRLAHYLVIHSIHLFLNGDETAHIAYLHNALYDIGVMSAMDLHLPDGSWIDTMDLAFLLGTEPLGLKPLSYRLRGMKMQSYEEQIGPTNEEMALNYLIEASLHEWPAAQEMLIRDGGEFRLKKPQGIGARINRILKDWAEQEIKVEHVTHVDMEDTNKAGVTKIKRHTHDYYEKKFGTCPAGCHEVKVEREKPVDIRDRWYKKGDAIEMDAENEEGDYRPEYDTTGQMLRAPVEEKLGRMQEATLMDIPEEQAVQYSTRDSDATGRIGPLLLSRVKDLDLTLPLKIDMGIQPMLARMMQVGIPADREHFIQFGKDCRARMDQIEFDIHNIVGRTINLASGPQLSYLLFNELRLPSQRWTKSHDQLAVDKKALEPLRYMHPVIPLVLEWSETETLLNNFAQILPAKMDAAGRVHAKIGMTRIPSGRLNTSDPNLMAMPTRSELGETIRKGFKAPKGYKFVTADKSQIELRAEGFLSMDPKLVEIFCSGKDAHTDTGSWMLGVSYEEMVKMLKSDDPAIHRKAKEKRAAGKTINFGLVNLITGLGLLDQFKLQGLAANEWAPNTVYLDPTKDKKGKVVYSMAQNTKGEPIRFRALTGGVSGTREPVWNFAPGAIVRDQSITWEFMGEGWTADKGDQFIAKWMGIYKGVPAWHERLFAEVRRTGFVRDLFGRLRYSPEIRSSIKRIEEAGKKQIANYPIQTTAINIVKIDMRLIWEQIQRWWARGIDVEPMLNVHDEILVLCREDAADEVGETMKEIMGPGITEELHRMGFDLAVPLAGAWGSGDDWGSIDK